MWEELVAAALLGTDRRPLPPLELPGVALPEEPEARLFRAAGVLALYRQAGRVPPRDDGPADAPAAEDGRPVAALPALPRELLPEWLDLVVRTGRRAPEEALPALLDLARADPRQHPRVMAAGGARAAWLARLRPEWDPADDAETFATRSTEQRAAALRRLRWRNAPAARELLERGWSEEPAAARIALVKALEVRLEPADEPFLERARGDRRKEVREEALGLLLRLPDSGPSRALWEGARGLLRLEGKRLHVQPPTGPPPLAGARGKMGERAWWLRETVARIPPWRWGPAEPLVAAAAASDHARALLEGWAVAAARFPRRDWAEALLAQPLEADMARRLVTALPPADREAVVAQPELLPACTHPWSAEFSRRWEAHVTRELVPRVHPEALGRLKDDLAPVRRRMRRDLLG